MGVKVPGWTARELEIVSGLRKLGDAAPDDTARERIKTEIQRRLDEPAPSRRRRMLANLLAAAAALAIALGSLGLLLSKDALPGDLFYGMKRAGEAAQLELTFGDEARAAKHLQFAATRLDELAALGSADTATYESTLADFANEARAGTAQLTTLAVQGGTRLDQLRSWTWGQNAKLSTLKPAIPVGPAVELLSRIDARAQALSGRLGCYQITSGEADDLGAMPALGDCGPPVETFTGGLPPVAPAPSDPRTPVVEQATSIQRSEAVEPAQTGLVPPSSGTPASTAIDPPITAPAKTPSAPPAPAPPVISVPPLLPGLPGVGIG